MSMSKIPKLRFKEFSGEWEKHSIENLVSKKILEKPLDGNHGNIHPTSSDYVPEGIPFVMANDIKNGILDLKNTKKITKVQADKLQKGFSLEGDVLLTHKGSVGLTAMVPVLNTEYIMLTPQVTYYRVINSNLLSNIFLKYCFDSGSFQTVITKFADSGTRPYIGITEQRKLELCIPKIEEQTKVASFLSTVDTKINQLTRKKELLEQYKKGVMQKIFSQELRFKTDDGSEFPEWEEKKFDAFIKEYKRKSTINNEYSVLTSSNKGLMLQSDYFGENRIVDRENVGFNVIPEGYITYRSRSDNRTFTFNINDVGFTGIISTYYPVFEFQQGNNKFFVELANYYQHIFGKYSVGTSQTVLSLNEIRNIKMKFPSQDEQIKIVNFLSAIDTKIDLATRQLDKAKNFKKALLQQMFT